MSENSGRRPGPDGPPARPRPSRGQPSRRQPSSRQPSGGQSSHGQSPRTAPPGDRPRPERRPATDARRVAYDAVAAVHRDDAYANLVLPEMLRRAQLDRRDAALATELAYGTLRRRCTLDEIIAAAADRPMERIDPPARDALRVGAYQLLFTRVPPHAAVSATVGLVRQVAPGATGFSNAVLRRVSDRSLEDWLAQVAPGFDDDPVAHLAVVHSHPAWIVRSFAESLGGDLAETARLLAEDNEPAPVHLCARPGRVTAAALADEVAGVPGPFSPYAVHLPAGPPGALAAVAQGRAHVQDEGSQLVVAALAAVPVPEGQSPRWLDTCAGPGGKAALLGALAAGRGATVTAVEIADHRAGLVEHAVRGLPVTVLRADARTVGAGDDLPAASFARVLVDAPCTGLGALRRRPEARWRRSPGDLPALTRLQRELLVAAIAATRPGGVVAYATCSPHVVETRVGLAEARRRSPHQTELIDAREHLPAGMPGLGDGPAAQLWPHRHGTDAMFLALLRRTA